MVNGVSRGLARRPFLWLFFISSVFLYLNLFVLPHTPVYRMGDGLTFLSNAVKMFEGQVIYRDFFQFTPPGTELVYSTLFKLFGVCAWIPNATLLLLGVVMVWLSCVISRHLMSGVSVILPALLFLTFAYRFWLDGTHHWFSITAVMAAVAVLIKERNLSRLAVAGAFCGLALCFTQLRGAVAVVSLAVFLVWESGRKPQRWNWLVRNAGALFAAFFATILVFNAYFVWQAGLKRFVECTLLFHLKYSPTNLAGSSWRVYFADISLTHSWYSEFPRAIAYLFIHLLVPLVYLLFFARYWRESPGKPLEACGRLMLVNVVGLFQFLLVAPGPGWLRLCSVSLPALIVLVWLLSQPGKVELAVSRLLWAGALVFLVTQPLSRQVRSHAYLATPVGRTAFLDSMDYEKHRWMSQRTRPGEFLFEDEFPRFYFSLGLRNPAPVAFLTNSDYTRPEQVEDVVEALEKHRVRFVLRSLWLDPSTLEPTPGDHLGPFREYVRAHYHIVKVFPDLIQVWERDK
jgi:hypothetical protein